MNDTERELWMTAALNQHSAPLTRYATALLRDPDRARDVVQDTFLRLWKENPEEVQPHLAEWLFTVCRHRALDLLRKDGRLQPLEDYEPNEPACPAPSPAAEAELRDIHERALHFVARLPRGQQEVLRLKFQNGLSYEEISRITHRTVNSVGVLIHVALKTVREQMQAEAEKALP